jgi:hypothetical protein
MAAVGKAEENGYAERFMRTIKEEEVDLSEYQDFKDAASQISRFIEDVYMTNFLEPRRVKGIHAALFQGQQFSQGEHHAVGQGQGRFTALRLQGCSQGQLDLDALQGTFEQLVCAVNRHRDDRAACRECQAGGAGFPRVQSPAVVALPFWEDAQHLAFFQHLLGMPDRPSILRAALDGKSAQLAQDWFHDGVAKKLGLAHVENRPRQDKLHKEDIVVRDVVCGQYDWSCQRQVFHPGSRPTRKEL